jgi:hypothetical protein
MMEGLRVVSGEVVQIADDAIWIVQPDGLEIRIAFRPGPEGVRTGHTVSAVVRNLETVPEALKIVDQSTQRVTWVLGGRRETKGFIPGAIAWIARDRAPWRAYLPVANVLYAALLTALPRMRHNLFVPIAVGWLVAIIGIAAAIGLLQAPLPNAFGMAAVGLLLFSPTVGILIAGGLIQQIETAECNDFVDSLDELLPHARSRE